jgi:hypothetical protein
MTRYGQVSKQTVVNANMGVTTIGGTDANVISTTRKNTVAQNYLDYLLDNILIPIIQADKFEDVRVLLEKLKELDPYDDIPEVTEKSIQALIRTQEQKLIMQDLEHRLEEIEARIAFNQNQNNNVDVDLQEDINIRQEVEGSIDAIFLLYITYFGPPEPVDTENTINGYDIDNLKLLLESFSSVDASKHSAYISTLQNILVGGNVDDTNSLKFFTFATDGSDVVIQGNQYKTSSSALDTSRFINTENDLYPFSFPQGGEIKFTASTSVSGETIDIQFIFEKYSNMLLVASYTTNIISIVSHEDNLYTETVPVLKNVDATTGVEEVIEYDAFYIKVLTRDKFVTIKHIQIIETGQSTKGY